MFRFAQSQGQSASFRHSCSILLGKSLTNYTSHFHTILVDSLCKIRLTASAVQSTSFSSSSMLEQLDPTQVSLLKEECIAVNEQDGAIASITKVNIGHLMYIY